jgi:hypothetical protein
MGTWMMDEYEFIDIDAEQFEKVFENPEVYPTPESIPP